MADFSQSTVMITGGSRGIGLATARAFLQAGARVAVCSRDKHALAQAELGLGELGEAAIFQADVRDYRQMESFAEQVLHRFEAIDVLVGNAGKAWMGYFAHQPVALLDEVLDTNVKGVLYAARAVLPHMLARNSGVIVNVCSGAGQAGIAGLASYCASKFAVLGFTESLAREVSGQGIRVYGVCPGAVATDMLVEVTGQREGIPPERAAEEIVRLAGPHPPVAPGECLEVFG